jgi:Cft2 family RNA processing exonuclease
MLEDAGRLAITTDANPLYTLNDVAETVDGLKPPKDGLLHLFRNLGQVELLESGHILGSRMILLEKNGCRVLFTGDFNTRPQITLPASVSLKGLQPDILIMESTYGYNADEWALPRSWQERAFIAHLDQVLRRGGVVLLPAFAVGRAKTLIFPMASTWMACHGLSQTVMTDLIGNCQNAIGNSVIGSTIALPGYRMILTARR